MTAATLPTILTMSHRKNEGPLQSYEITQELKDEFINLIYDGLKADAAASEIGTTGTRIKRLRRRGATHYDADFAQRWIKAELSEEHAANHRARIESLLDKRAEESDTILLKQAMAYVPAYEKLRHQNFHHDHATRVQIIAEDLPWFTREEIEAALARKDAGELPPVTLRALPPAEES